MRQLFQRRRGVQLQRHGLIQQPFAHVVQRRLEDAKLERKREHAKIGRGVSESEEIGGGPVNPVDGVFHRRRRRRVRLEVERGGDS